MIARPNLALVYGDVTGIVASLRRPTLTVPREHGRTSWWEQLLRFPRGRLVWWERFLIWIGFPWIAKERMYVGRILSHPEYAVFEPALFQIAVFERLFAEVRAGKQPTEA